VAAASRTAAGPQPSATSAIVVGAHPSLARLAGPTGQAARPILIRQNRGGLFPCCPAAALLGSPAEDDLVPRMRSTTILAVRPKGGGALGGDGQVTLGNVVMKSDAHKIRRLHEGKVLTGFAGSSADAFALLERFEAKLKDFQGNVPRAATELAKDWRMDRNLR